VEEKALDNLVSIGRNLAEQVLRMERDRILQKIQELEDQSHATRTPLYQETLLAKIREIVNASGRFKYE
jgi:hypothetical protein